jgi:hypothetical protein
MSIFRVEKYFTRKCSWKDHKLVKGIDISCYLGLNVLVNILKDYGLLVYGKCKVYPTFLE